MRTALGKMPDGEACPGDIDGRDDIADARRAARLLERLFDQNQTLLDAGD